MDLTSIKTTQQQMWAKGDYAVVAAALVIVGEQLCEALDVRAGRKALDIATGSGNTALALARRGCEATGADYVPELLQRARERAAVERLSVTFVQGDAEALPFPDNSFDYVTSTFGVMFAPDQPRAAAELLRVCRPGGRIGLANWSPDGFVGEWFRTTARFAPPPPGLRSPLAWGTEQHLRELLGPGCRALQLTRRSMIFRYRSARHWLDFFRTYFGPTMRAFESLDAPRQREFEAALLELVERFNRSGDETIAAPGDYLEIVAIRA